MKTSKRALFAMGAFAALLPFGVTGVAAAGLISPVATVASGFATALDSAIDAAVARKVAADRLSPADALVAREQMQMQFLSLSIAAQRALVARMARVAGDETVGDVGQALTAAVEADVRQALADAQGTGATSQAEQLTPKLGADGDLVFVATAGPCRVWDSRFGLGQMPAFSAQQIYVYSSFAGYTWNSDNQGGSGTAGSGNCAGTVYGGAVRPTSVVATVTVVNTGATGSLQAWNGGTTLTVGAILAWNPGDRLSNTTVIPINRSITPYPGSGFKRDIAVNNNSGAGIDVVVDVVGYFIQNQATALDCTTVTSGAYNIGAGGNLSGASPACGAGYTRVTTTCFPAHYTVYQVGVSGSTCYFHNSGGSASSFTATSMCCRVPGR